MRHIRSIAAIATGLAAACSPAGSDGAAAGAVATQAANPAAPPAAAPPPAAPTPAPPPSSAPGRKLSEATARYTFDYSYPAAAAAIPGLATALEDDLARRRAKLRRDAADGEAAARKDGFPYHAYSWSQEWQVVSDLPGWLSLSANFASYTGGAHGMAWFGAMLWDKQAGKARDPLTLFTSRAALERAIRKPFCDGLNRQRAVRRGAPVKPGSTEEFDRCIAPLQQTVILGSRSRQRFDRIGILVAPYEAGPYAEGTYEVTVPVTPAVLAAVRPEFRASFAAAR